MPESRVAAAVPGLTVALLGNLDVRREFGKVGTQSDIHLHELKEGGRDITVIVPARYPEGNLKSLSYALTGCDVAVLVVDKLGAAVGEQILAADAAGIKDGVLVLQNYIQPEQVKPILKGTTLEGWTVFTEDKWSDIRAKLAAHELPARDGPVYVPIDHHFNVKGVGAVILGVVKQGVLRKGDTLHAFPDKVICPVRSIQIHDVDHDHAVVGDRVGLALRNTPPELLDRGQILAPADAPLKVHAGGAAIELRLKRSAFSKQPLKSGAMVQIGVGMQFVPMRLTADAPGPGTEGTVKGTLEKGLVHTPNERAILWHVDNAPQRVVGTLTLT